MAKLLLLHGPNLNLLGTREPDKYGTVTLAQINQRATDQVQAAGHSLEILQSNSESELVERIHQASRDDVVFIVINPAAYTHTSVAIPDALTGTNIPFIEIHLSNIHRREPFRHHSYFSAVAVGTIVGLGAIGYELALEAAMQQLASTT